MAPRVLGDMEVHQAALSPSTGRLEGVARRPVTCVATRQERVTGGPRLHVGNEPDGLADGAHARAAACADAEAHGPGVAIERLRRRMAVLSGVAR